MDDFIGGNGYNNQSEDQAKTKKIMKIIGVFIFLLFIACIALVVAIYYIQYTQLKVNLDGKLNNKLKDILIFEGEEIYVPIRAFAEYVGYQSSNGGYKQYTEDITKCYVECANEVATFSLNSNKIYKIVLENGSNDTEYYEISKPIKIINNQLCTTIEGARIAFNIAMSYNTQTNTISINTLPYLVNIFTERFQNAGISDKDASFSNQKALLYNMIVVKNTDGHYGVYSLDGKEILGTKYAKVKFIESTQEFIVTTLENKVGIMLHDSSTKISPEYDDIKQIDKDSGLYLVKNNNKYGVINSKQSIVVYLEYDQIGINNSLYKTDIENQYLLYSKCIPARQNNKWCLFDVTGRKLTELIYDDLGCSVGNKASGDQNANNVLLIPQYEGIVVKTGDVYGLIDSDGKLLIQNVLTSFYSITSSGETTYYMTTDTQKLNVIEYIKKYVKNNENTEQENNNQDENTEQSQNNNQNENAEQPNNNQNENTENQNNNQNENTNQQTSNSETAPNNQNVSEEQVNN